ncbi:MAG TPA: hypothetical protein VFQ45_00435 [Longimicrobium sp.]|nr:hypothetical protein [Longimicrobium sp.]
MDGNGDMVGRRARNTAWICLLLAAAANTAGYALGIWHSPVWFDEVVHAYTTFALTLVLAFHLHGRVYTGARTHPATLTLAVASVGVAIGAIWEIAEWAYDQWIAPGDAILGKWDTITDLGYDTLGALIAAAIATAVVRRQPARRPASARPPPQSTDPARPAAALREYN